MDKKKKPAGVISRKTGVYSKKLTAAQKELMKMTPAQLMAAAEKAAKASGSSKPVKAGVKKKPRPAPSMPMSKKRSAEAVAALKAQEKKKPKPKAKAKPKVKNLPAKKDVKPKAKQMPLKKSSKSKYKLY